MEKTLQQVVQEAQEVLAKSPEEDSTPLRDESKDVYVYKIQRRSDGWFSEGGMDGGFNKRGKVWATTGALRNHLNIAPKNIYEGCMVIKYRLESVNETQVKYFMEEKKK